MAFKKASSLGWQQAILFRAILQAFLKLSLTTQLKNPVIFTVYVASIVSTLLFIVSLIWFKSSDPTFILSLLPWIWGTVLFANFAESMAEGRGRAQADSLRKNRQTILAKKIEGRNTANYKLVAQEALRMGDRVLVEQGDFIPSDGEIVEGIASVNESAITGESAPVIREAGGDRSSVVGGTQVLSDWLIIKITANPGETFLDNMISLVEGAKRQKTPNELALTILLSALTLVFLVVSSTLLPFSVYSASKGMDPILNITQLIALFVCLACTTIGGLMSAIGIAGMNRMIQANVIPLSGHAVEAAGDVDILLLDKTGTITLGNRQAVEFIPAQGVQGRLLADAAQLASLTDETPEGRSIVILAKEEYGLRARNIAELGATFIPFTAETRMSGANLPGRQIRKGAEESIRQYVTALGGTIPIDVKSTIDTIARKGGTPLIVVEGNKILGVVHLKDIVKGGIRERFSQLRQMGIKTIMITGDNPLTAAAIAAEAGVDDFLANAKPVDKIRLIQELQSQGHLVAMTGDGTNDAPALAQADVAVAMNTGTQAAKEAGNLIDLDSNPTKLIEIIGIGKQLLVTRGALTTFSIANDIAKYFAILPAIFSGIYPPLNQLNIMQLATPHSAILSSVIFNTLIIIFLIPLALRGVNYKQGSSESLLKRNVLIYGGGGMVVPFIGIKLIDLILVWLRLT